MTNDLSPRFYRIAAAASLLSVVTTALLIFLPQFFAPVSDDLAGRMQRVLDPVYQVRSWAYLIHPFLVFMAAAGVAAACRRVAAVWGLCGLLGVGLWALTEAGQQTLTLFAFDDWRRAWLAGDPVVRTTMELRAAIYDGIWNASFSLLLLGFAIGVAFFTAILVRLPDSLSKVLGFFLLGTFLTTLSNLSGQVGGWTIPETFGFWIYPAVQLPARILLGVWLLRVARDGEPRLIAQA